MKIEKDKYVSIHYTLKDKEENVLDSSYGTEPLSYIHGRGYLIPGLERELEGKSTGEKFSAIIQAKDGYGEYKSELVMEVSRDRFDTDFEIELGMQFQAMTAAGPSIVRVIEINGDKIKIDANHEMAGKELHFEVEIVDVRNASEEELNPPSCACSCGSGCSGNCGSNCGGCSGCF